MCPTSACSLTKSEHRAAGGVFIFLLAYLFKPKAQDRVLLCAGSSAIVQASERSQGSQITLAAKCYVVLWCYQQETSLPSTGTAALSLAWCKNMTVFSHPIRAQIFWELVYKAQSTVSFGHWNRFVSEISELCYFSSCYSCSVNGSLALHASGMGFHCSS